MSAGVPTGYGAPRRRTRRQFPMTLRGIPDGYRGVQQIVAHMSMLSREAIKDERVSQLAREITMGCASHDYNCEVQAIHDFMQRHFRYTRLPWDPQGIQRIQTPSYTLFDSPTRSGECASLSTAEAALLMSVGIKPKFRAAGSDPNDPLFFEHVFLMIEMTDGAWVASDPSYDGPLGWEHPNTVIRKDFPIA